MNPRSIILGVLVVAVSFIGATLAMNVLWPRSPASLKEGRPTLVAVPPLKPLAGVSTVLAPAAITMSAIGEALNTQAPRNLAGKRPGAVSPLMPDADIHWTVTRGPLNVSGQPDALVVATPLSGAFQARGTISTAANAVGGAVGNIIGTVAGGVGQQVQNLVGKTFDQRADIRGTVTATARPSIGPNWRLTPNLAAQINVADVVVPIAGVIKLSVAKEVKPFLDNAVHEQTTALETRLRNDPFIENAARNEWSKLCRSISLGAAGQGMPNLWLEVRPTHAIAAQPKIDANALTLFVGVQAETRIVPAETKPDCPFPEQLEIVPQANEGTVEIIVPIDIPFTEVSRLIDAQLKDKTFPEDGSGKYAATIKQAEIAASGDRLLISLLVNVKRDGLFSVGADATVHVWDGRCWIRSISSCASPTSSSTCNPRRRSGCSAKRRRLPCLICSARSPKRRSSTSSPLRPRPRSAWPQPSPISPAKPEALAPTSTSTRCGSPTLPTTTRRYASSPTPTGP